MDACTHPHTLPVQVVSVTEMVLKICEKETRKDVSQKVEVPQWNHQILAPKIPDLSGSTAVPLISGFAFHGCSYPWSTAAQNIKTKIPEVNNLHILNWTPPSAPEFPSSGRHCVTSHPHKREER